MASDDSVQPDASTVHRSGMVANPDAKDPSGDVEEINGLEAAEIAEARTVIRGSSRASDPRSAPVRRVDQTPAAVAKILAGTRLNHFLLEEMIGGGGMGAVFRARDEQLDRTVAIKVIPFVGDDPDLQRRFRNEAQSAAKLDHPHIARVFEVGSHEDWHYIVFEYIRGTNIRDLVTTQGVLSIDDAVFYTCQLAEALQHAADRGIVHRDIKPSNVLIGQDDKIKLVDMGLARSDNFDLSEDMTASGVTLGTFDYISPEQARDPRVADVRSDIYSLGCTLYFMLTGSPPYPGGTMLQKLLSHGNAPPPDVRQLRPEVSDDLMIVINKMLAKNPEDRYGSGSDLVADLREVAFRDSLKRSQGIQAVAAPEPNRLAVWLERHAPWLIAATLLLLSTAWLQLISAASRDEFSLTAPTSATVLRDTTSTNLTQQTVNQESPGGGSAEASSRADSTRQDGTLKLNPAIPEQMSPETEISESDQGATSNRSYADPPRLQNIPIPDELNRAFQSRTAVEPTGPRDGITGNDSDVAAESVQGWGSSMGLIRVVSADSSLRDYQRDDDGAALVQSLADALRLAREYDVDRIEIATPKLQSGPLRIEKDGLLITASPEIGECLVQLRPRDSITMQRSTMIDIGSNRVEFEDLHFQWTVSSSDIDGGALFDVKDNRLVRMTDCSITIDNPSQRDDVFAFDVDTVPGRLKGVVRGPGAPRNGVLPLVAIELNNVIVRGQVTMIHMDHAIELQLQWDNGLLAITQRMIDTMGASSRPLATAGPIQLSLTRLTALVPQGLVRMRLGVGAEYPVAIDRDARSCVFVVDEGTPHFEISGLSSFDDADSLLKLRGEANAYDVDPSLVDPVLLLSDTEGRIDVTRMDDVKSMTPSWSDETSPRWSVRWSEPRRSDSSYSRLTADDFLQYGTVLSGFDAALLPRLPAHDPTATDIP